MASASKSDPFQMWRDWLGQSERQMSEAANELMARPEFGESSGKMLEAFSAYQGAMKEATQKYLDFANIASRDDLAVLGERLNAIDDRLGTIEAMLSERVGGRPAPAAPRPRRTRKPSTQAATPKAGNDEGGAPAASGAGKSTAGSGNPAGD